jgi:hypothetical protein
MTLRKETKDEQYKAPGTPVSVIRSRFLGQREQGAIDIAGIRPSWQSESRKSNRS